MAEKKIIRADGTPVKAVSAEEKKDKVTTAAAAKTKAPKTVNKAEEKPVQVKPAAPDKDEGSAAGLRIGAGVLWFFAIAFEVLAVLVIFGKITLTFIPTIAQIIILLVLDLACVSGGSILWKKANRIDPASGANKVKFWLWNNMGLIVTAFAFIPFIILALTNKNADKKTKTIAVVVAVIALLIGGLVGYDWNPISAEEKDAAVETFNGTDVYWTPFGTVYHTSQECSHLNHSDTLVVGSVEQAIEANRTRLCKTCAARDNIVIDTEKSELTADDTLEELNETAEEIIPDDAADEALEPIEETEAVDAAA